MFVDLFPVLEMQLVLSQPVPHSPSLSSRPLTAEDWGGDTKVWPGTDVVTMLHY